MSLTDSLDFGLWGRRLPMILQTEAAECGLACLTMLTRYHGRQAELTDVRRRLAYSLKGATLKDLVGMAGRLGFGSRPVRLELDELPMLKTPCVLHWNLNHFVVLRKATRDRVVLHDPAVGIRHMRLSEVSRHFTGVAIELTPLGDFETAEKPPSVRLSSLLGRIIGLPGSLMKLFALALALEVFTIAGPLFMQWVVDHVLVSADQALLTTLALGFGLLLLLRTLVSAMRGWLVVVLGVSMNVQGRANLFSHLLNLPTSFFETRHLGDVMSRFGSQDTILRAISTEVVETVLDGLLAIVTLAIMYLYSPLLATIALAGAVVYGLLRWALFRPLRQASAEAIVWSARGDSHFLETLRGITTVKLFAAQADRRVHWLNLLVEAFNRDLTVQKLSLLFRLANGLLIGGLFIFVVWLGAHRVIDNLMSIGMLLAFLAYKDQFLRRVSALIDRAADLMMLRLHAERLADIALTPPEPEDSRFDDEPITTPVAIEVRDLRFRYAANEPWVLDGVNLRVEPGEAVALAGASGCGKTTLLKIIAGLLPVTEGEVLVNGEPLAQFGVCRWRAMLGVVMQDDQLFAGSIADNISFFSRQPDYDHIHHCARLAAVHDDIVAMPMGYDTLIGDMGTLLSGGQKQRVLIARALYRRPSVLLLDEASSHLDVATEQAVNAAIRATHVTRLICAHRLETLQSADRVVMLTGGCVDQSAVVRLLERRPTFARDDDCSDAARGAGGVD